MISYSDALGVLLREARLLGSERVDLDAAVRRFLANDVISPLSLPSFDNAAMDGYAVRTSSGTIHAGTRYIVTRMHAAGAAADSYPDADACEIATGARMPAGFDTVVPLERSTREGDSVRFLTDEARGQNVRHVGTDIEAGAIALGRGRRIDGGAIMLLAALGVDRVDVVRRPRVAVITTGSELHASGPLPAGGIHDSNSPFLAASLVQWGAVLTSRTRVPDTGDAFHAAVGAAVAAGVDLIVTTGAVSAGRFDFVPHALISLGGRQLFHKVAIRPGKPLLASRLDDGPLVLALPGNPIAVAVGYRFFVAPVLRALAGLPPEQGTRVHLAEPFTLREGTRQFALGRMERDDEGRQVARLSEAQAAYRILPYAHANTWLSPVEQGGDTADAWPIDPEDAT